MKEPSNLSRREFAALAAAVAAAPFARAGRLSGAAAITATDVIERIKKNIGIEWKPDSVDAVKAGDPSTIATGIVTTSMATLAVLQQAVKAGANFVITAHPTFYARADVPAPPAGRGAANQAAASPDPVFAAKNEFITRNNLVVFRLSDHWRQRQPDPRAQGIAAALGWSTYQSAGDPERFQIPARRLDALAGSVKNALRSRGGIRVVGDPRTMVQRVGLLPGTTPVQAALKMLPNVDVIVAGEVREWESVEYARDKVFAGEKKGLILVGRIVSDEPGMEVCANWLKTFVSEVPIRHISAGDPYWRPS
jgi:putative NIF3 family GTP cyclohydrolase 1 type 2